MNTALKSFGAIVALTFCAALAPPPPRIDYTLTPILEGGVLQAVQVDMRFTGEADGETGLRLPNSWGGQDELWRSLRDIAVISGATLQPAEEPARRVLRHRPNARIHLRYRIVQDFEGPPNARQGNAYRPVIQRTYFHLIGDASFITPDAAELFTYVRVNVRRLPRGWRMASDLTHAPLALGRLWASVTVAGDFRVLERRRDNVRVAMRGQWSFSDDAFADEVAAIIAAQRRFFGDPPSPYLVTVLQLESPSEGWLSVGGTGLGDAFAFFATPNGEARHITRTLAHEGLHSWIPSEIGGVPEENEAAHYWLSEGFTDFYTGRLLVREGLWTPAQFAADFNAMLGEYGRSAARNATNARVVEAFWSDREVQRLPYQRGRFLATVWDQRLRANGRSLDDVVLDMRARAEAGDPSKAADMLPLVMRRFGVDVAADIDAHIMRGEPILLPEDALAPCGRIETRETRVFHRGFNIEATTANNNIIAGLDPAHPAYAAGLRDGMVLLRRDAGEIGNAELEIAYVVRDGETERTIRYMPQAAGSYTLQQLVLADPLEGEVLARCVAVLGGT